MSVSLELITVPHQVEVHATDARTWVESLLPLHSTPTPLHLIDQSQFMVLQLH